MRAMIVGLRPSPLAGLALTLIAIVVAGCAATPAPTPAPTVVPTTAPVSIPEPSVAPSVPATPTVGPTPAFTGDPFAGALPLPDDLRLGQGDIAVAPVSPTGLATGLAMPFDLGHCGLFSPVDLDGSLWEPVGGVDRQGGPIDTAAEVGDLINGTPGAVMLVSPERLDWRATSSGVVVVFRRLPGGRDYPGCM